MNEAVNEAMDILQEECAEVIQAVSKCRRFGLNNIKPSKDRTNLECLEEEIGDLMAMIDILVDKNILLWDNLELAKTAKKEKLKKWSNIYEQN
jgi:NTP pyrophosphatase (non-canonical NTP hydrolase)